MKKNRSLQFATKAVHAGERGPRPEFTPVSTPIYASVGYLYDTAEELDIVFGGQKPGYVYARHGNPTVAAFEEAIAALEDAEGAVAFSSGMAAIHASVLALGIGTGDRLVASRDIYGATYALFNTLLTTLGIKVTFIDACDISAVRRTLEQERPKAILVETVSNPLLKVADLETLVESAHARGAKLIVDSTFTTPFLTRPLDYGADLVVHSSTKYLGGHGDVLGGAAAGSAELCGALRAVQRLTGGSPGPMDAWLTLRGLKTLPLRMERQCDNARQIATWLSQHPKVASVNYPGLPAHSQHQLATKLFPGNRFGGMVSFEIADGDREKVFGFMDALELCIPATTLGDVHTLILYPAMSSHRSLTAEQRREVGISDALVRLSVGIEDAQDIIADLDAAFGKV